MSQHPGFCACCHEDKVRAKHRQSRIDWRKITFSTSGSLGGAYEHLQNLRDPYEYEDESYCANINCTDDRENIPDDEREEGQERIPSEIDEINRGLGHAARTGDWTKIDKENLERLEQLSEQATEVTDVVGIDWLDNGKTEAWEKIQDRIDEFEQNTGEAIERTAEVASTPDATVPGTERINECRSTLDNLDEVRHNIHVQDVVVDTVHQVVERETEHEVVVDAETAISENDKDEQQEREEADQIPDKESTETQKRSADLEKKDETLEKEEENEEEEENEDLEKEYEELKNQYEDLEDKKGELETKVEELTDDKRDLVDDKQELVDENHKYTNKIRELQQKLQQLQANNQQVEAEREPPPNEPSTDTSAENKQAEASANTGVVANVQQWVQKSSSKVQQWIRSADAETTASDTATPESQQPANRQGDNREQNSGNGTKSNGSKTDEYELTVLEQHTENEQDFDNVVGTTEQATEREDDPVSNSHDDRDEEHDDGDKDGKNGFGR